MKKLLIILLLSISFISCTKEDVIPINNCEGCYTSYICGNIIEIENLWIDCNKISITTTNALGEEIIIISDCINDIDILDYYIGDNWCKN